MKIETTVYLASELIDAISSAADKLGVTRSAVISSLVGRMSRAHREYESELHGVRYQERDAGADRRRIHVRVSNGEYELFLDERKVFKMSVSFIIAVAVERFLDEVIELIETSGDTYRCQNYAIMQIDIENVTSWVIYWGIPTRLLTL